MDEDDFLMLTVPTETIDVSRRRKTNLNFMVLYTQDTKLED